MTKKELKKISADIQEIVTKSKATFFVSQNSPEPPVDEVLMELKAQISDSIGIYFYELMYEKK